MDLAKSHCSKDWKKCPKVIHDCKQKDKNLRKEVEELSKSAHSCKDLKFDHRKHEECVKTFEKKADCLNKDLMREEDMFDKCILEEKHEDKYSDLVKEAVNECVYQRL